MFHFKQFSIKQSNCAMKIGTDSILLGAWAPINHCSRILDIGTGTGILALMLAQRHSEAIIDAIEIEPTTYEQAKYNFSNSPWSERINIKLCAIQNYSCDYQYDLIISNPPYFYQDIKPQNLKRSIARHNTSMSPEDIMDLSMDLLSSDGKLAIIIPTQDSQRIAQNTQLYLCKSSVIYHQAHLSSSRSLLLFQKSLTKPAIDSLVIKNSLHGLPYNYSRQYQNLTKDFHPFF